MKIIDLTHTISESMPVYPGTERPLLKVSNTYEEHGFKETLLTMYSHTGTHMDAPAHIFKEKKALDDFPASHFVGKGLVIDCRNLVSGDTIDFSFIQKVRSLADQADYLLFNTGWDKYWGEDAYFGSYPCIDENVAEYLISNHKKGIGLDTIGLDPVKDSSLTLHHKVLGLSDFVIIENLTNLDAVGNDLFTFIALPIKFNNSDGAPIRAIAILDREECIREYT